jgi:hypothetical protein
MLKTIIHNNNKIEIQDKPLIGEEVIFYNNKLIPPMGTFGNVTNVFVVFEQGSYVQYDVEFSLRWHCMGFKTTIKRREEIIYSDK